MNIHKPIMADPMAVINTAPAEISFAFFASGFIFGLVLSMTITG